MIRARLFVLTLLVLPTLSVGARAEGIPPTEPREIDVAAVALVGVGGNERRLDEILPPGPAIVHFWATWCVPCRDELPALDRFRAALAPDGRGRVLVVSVDRFAFSKVEAFLRDELGLPDLTTWKDANGKAGAVFRLFGYPDTVLLDAEHREVGRRAGSLDWDDPEVRLELMERLAGAKP